MKTSNWPECFCCGANGPCLHRELELVPWLRREGAKEKFRREMRDAFPAETGIVIRMPARRATESRQMNLFPGILPARKIG